MFLFMRCCFPALIFMTAMAQQPVTRPGESDDLLELSRLEKVWNDAYIRGDVVALDQLWGDDLIVTMTEMTVMTKSEALGLSRSGRLKFPRYETSDIRIRVYNDAAVVTGRLQRTRKISGRSVDDDWRFTKVYVRRAGRWQVVAWQASTSANSVQRNH